MKGRRRALVVLAGFALDRLVGDPVRPTHPARLMGTAIAGYEGAVLPRTDSGADRRMWGTALAFGLPLAVYGLVRALLGPLPRGARFAAEAWLIGTALAGKDLGAHARRVMRALDAGVEEGRAEVAFIVGRDTAEMSEAEVVRATVETVAENTSDGVVAPLFYAVLGGAPLALAYKSVSTLDSMVGYKNDRYRDFGRASARLDDVLNFVPARLTAVLATIAGRGGTGAVRGWWRDRVHHDSPNAGLVEASFAHNLGLRLGGPARYGGVVVERARVGNGNGRSPQPADVERAVALSDDLAVLGLGLGVGALVATGRRSSA